MKTIENHRPEDRYVVHTGRTDIKPGDYFEHGEQCWQALTYPNGAIITYAPGVSFEHWEPYDPEIYKPPIGTVTAIRVDRDRSCQLESQ